MIYEKAVGDPEAVALDDFTRRRTWRELEDRVHRVARLLRDDLGLGADEHAAFLMGNRVEGVELIVGGILAGVWMTPINSHLTPDEVRHVVKDSGAKVVFCDTEHAEAARAAGAPEILLAGDELDAALASASAEPVALEGPAGGNMIYTSGTSGQPKGVKRRRAATVAAALEAARAYGHAVGLDGTGAHLVTGPLYHAAPLMFAIYDQWNGAPVLVMPRWDEREFLRLVQERSVRHTHLVPTMCVRLLRLPDAEREAFDASGLALVLHGAAPIAPAVKRRMIEWLGPLIVEYWGGTEGGVTTLVGSEEWLEHAGTVGRALPAFEVFAVDDEGRRLPPGESGLLYSRHKTTPRFFEYHGDRAKTEGAYLDEHTFTLGDLGFVDAEGYVHLGDRRSNLIISGGVNVYPAEVEHVLQEHPAVADVGVFGVPDEEWGETVKAAVELRPGHDPSPELAREILDFGRERLARYKVPRSVDFEAELPRHPTGKLLVRRLRERYAREGG
ncbi:MAG: AMP-binding protein [Myxococcota bacterium]|nr:AMP-binding protein [Myxococcota bacterium]